MGQGLLRLLGIRTVRVMLYPLPVCLDRAGESMIFGWPIHTRHCTWMLLIPVSQLAGYIGSRYRRITLPFVIIESFAQIVLDLCKFLYLVFFSWLCLILAALSSWNLPLIGLLLLSVNLRLELVLFFWLVLVRCLSELVLCLGNPLEIRMGISWTGADRFLKNRYITPLFVLFS